MAGNVEVADGVECRRIRGDLYMPVPAAAKYANVCVNTMWNWSYAGRLRIRRFGRKGFVSKSALDEILVGTP